MLKRFNKYFISSLAVLLIFSNFSFATSVMLCRMSEDVDVCYCNHNSRNFVEESSGIYLSKVKKPCCDIQMKELSNSNTLLTLKNELPKKINAIDVINIKDELNQSGNISFNPSAFALLKYKIPKTDIPITNSSLLI